MVVFNPAKREIGAKIVFYGPAAGGKTTNLQFIYSRLKPNQRGELVSLATKDDRTLFFDFLPLDLGTVKGFKVRFHLYTVPGQVYYVSTRRAVLTGVDGLVFVVDSQEEKLAENIESLEDLEKNLLYYGKKLDELPMIIQYNKRDLKNILPVSTLDAKLNFRNLSVIEAVALTGRGVMETLTNICKAVLDNLEDSSQKLKSRTFPYDGIKIQPGTEIAGGNTRLSQGGIGNLIELQSEERIFDIERLRAERRATIDRLLKQKAPEVLTPSLGGESSLPKEQPLFEKTSNLKQTESIEKSPVIERVDLSEEIELVEEISELNKSKGKGELLASELDIQTREEELKGEQEDIPLELEDNKKWMIDESGEKDLTSNRKENLETEKELLSLDKLGDTTTDTKSALRGIEIVDWGNPEKIFPASIKLPITLSLAGINKKAKITITINLEELI